MSHKTNLAVEKSSPTKALPGVRKEGSQLYLLFSQDKLLRTEKLGEQMGHPIRQDIALYEFRKVRPLAKEYAPR